MRSSWSLGVLFVVLGGLSVAPLGAPRFVGPVQWALAGLLVAAGAFVFTKLRAAYFVALAVATLTVVTGVIALAHHPELALPVSPYVSIGVGLYLVFRTTISSPLFGARKKGFLP
jgi:hypothetical protein